MRAKILDRSGCSGPAAGRRPRRRRAQLDNLLHGLLADVLESRATGARSGRVRDGAGPADGYLWTGHRRGVVPIRRLALHARGTRLSDDAAAARSPSVALCVTQPREPAGRARRRRGHPRGRATAALHRAHTARACASTTTSTRARRGSRRRALDRSTGRELYTRCAARRGRRSSCRGRFAQGRCSSRIVSRSGDLLGGDTLGRVPPYRQGRHLRTGCRMITSGGSPRTPRARSGPPTSWPAIAGSARARSAPTSSSKAPAIA